MTEGQALLHKVEMGEGRGEGSGEGRGEGKGRRGEGREGERREMMSMNMRIVFQRQQLL